MTVIEYCTEEVERQGHDTSVLDGIERVGWMLEAWSYAIIRAKWNPSVQEAIELGKRVEILANKRGIRKVGVRVGSKICPPAKTVIPALVELFSRIDVLTPLEFYKEFELIHPFIDGNGRTGKILLNWKNGTLLNPFFPPDDIFGYPIRNP